MKNDTQKLKKTTGEQTCSVAGRGGEGTERSRGGSTPWVAVVALAGAAMLWADVGVGASDAFASELGRNVLGCRRAVVSGAARSIGIAAKTHTSCYKRKARGLVHGVTNCGVLDDADVRHRAKKARQKLLDKVGGGKDRCGLGVDLNAAGFEWCPASCGGFAIANSQDLGACLQCITEELPAQIYSEALNKGPGEGTGKAEQRCMATIGKTATKHLGMILKTGLKCQNKLDKDAASVETTDCYNLAAAPDGPGMRTLEGLTKRILDHCSAADLTVVQSCASDAEGVAACVGLAADTYSLEILDELLDMPKP